MKRGMASCKLVMNCILHLMGCSNMNFTCFFSLPDPEQDIIGLRKVEGGTAAVLKFSGKPTEEIVLEKAKELRSSLIKDGLKPSNGCLLARYNDPGRTWNFIMVSLKSMCLSIICCWTLLWLDIVWSYINFKKRLDGFLFFISMRSIILKCFMFWI